MTAMHSAHSAHSPDLSGDLPGELSGYLVSALREEVAMLRLGERRRSFPLQVHLGIPAGPRWSTEIGWPEPSGYDAGLRTDIVSALVATVEQEAPSGSGRWLWLSRPGVPELHQHDLDWAAAGTRAADAHGHRLAGVLAVTRYGWLDIATGASRRWKRLRLRGGPGTRTGEAERR